MGASGSKEKLLNSLPETGERFYGLENFGNTCYANSVLQTLYSCQPFRERLLQYAAGPATREAEETILSCLADLFLQISTQKRRTGVISPKRFIQKLKRDKEQFRSYDEHQDAHELLLDLLNDVSELLEAEHKRTGNVSGVITVPASLSATADAAVSLGKKGSKADAAAVPAKPTLKTWVHSLFQGREVHETRCLWCETVTKTETEFYALSLAITQNSSLTNALRSFSATETLQGDDKFFCNACGTYQEATKRTRLVDLPDVLLLHLSRFKYTTTQDRDGYMRVQRSKLMYRVVFPFELKLGCAAAEGCDAADTPYSLFAVIVHVGSGLDHGHYVALVKNGDKWLLFEDESVELVNEGVVQSVFGSSQEHHSHVGHGYILMYEKTQPGATAAPPVAIPGLDDTDGRVTLVSPGTAAASPKTKLSNSLPIGSQWH